MDWIPTKSSKEITRLFNEFCSIYGSQYFELMGDEFIRGFMNSIGSRHCYSEFEQIYSFLKIISPEDDPYAAHLNNIQKYHSLNGNVLEVAGGALPILSNLIAKEQLRIGSGTVTVYDPRLMITKPEYPNMTLCRDKFTEDTDISKFDLVVSLFPCMVTEELLYNVCKSRKDFYITFCGCNHHDKGASFFNFDFSRPSYFDNIILAQQLCDENDLGEVEILDLPKKYDLLYPIIHNVR